MGPAEGHDRRHGRIREHVATTGPGHLILAGPNVSGVTDDPEGAADLENCIRTWRELPHSARQRIHLACLPVADVEENAVIVNALQRHASVVVQKSLAEGFGLTVLEAMWKGRPIVASGIGGIRDQVTDGESGLLLHDPTDLPEFGRLVRQLLDNPAEASALGACAAERAAQFLPDLHLIKWATLLSEVSPDPVCSLTGCHRCVTRRRDPLVHNPPRSPFKGERS